MNQRWLGNLALIAVATTWGTMIPLLTHLTQRWDPYFLAAIRYVTGVPLIYGALWLIEGVKRPATNPPRWRVLMIGWLGLASFAFLFTIGVAHANPIIAAVLAAANPVITAFIGRVFFALPLDRAMTPAIVLAFLGCCLATIDWQSGRLELALKGGEFLILIAAGCWAWYSLAIHRWLRPWSQLRMAAQTMAAAAPMLIAGYFLSAALGLTKGWPAAPMGWDAAMFVWMAVGPVVLGLLLWNFGVSRVGIMVAILYVNLTPIIAVCILAITGRPPNAAQIVGGLLVIGGVVWCEARVLWRARRLRARTPK